MKLFKIFTVGALLIGAATSSYAQEESSYSDSMDISFGVKGGVNFATLNGGDIDGSPDSRTNFHAGVFAEFPMTNMFSIQAEALYSGQGAELDFRGTDGDRAEFQLDYINVPVLAKFYLAPGLSIEAGPQFSFLLNDEIDFNPNSDGGDSPSPIRDNLKTFEFGVAGGLSFELPVGIFATARYNQGITDIADDFNVQNSVFQLGVGYKF